MDKLRFERPTKERFRDAIDYCEEFRKFNSPIEGVNGLHRFLDNYDLWLDKVNSERTQDIDDKNVPMETFFIIREADNKLVGVINLRLALNKRFNRFGLNAGISIRPTERGKDYASIASYGMLKYFDTLGIDTIKLDVDTNNKPSKNNILHMGGKLIKEEYIEDLETVKEDYSVDVRRALEENMSEFQSYFIVNDIFNDKENDEILNLFYGEILPEAKVGNIDAYFSNKMVFGTIIEGKLVTRANEEDFGNVLIPYLNINNKKMFDKLLIEYVNKAIEFYSNDSRNFAFLNDLETIEERRKYLIKYVLGYLFANASYVDFENPIGFLKTRIAMFENRLLEEEKEIYLESIGATLYLREEMAPIKAESPYRINGVLKYDDGYELMLPDVYMGSDGVSNYLYTIMSKGNEEIDRDYVKLIRKGMIAKVNGAPEHYFLASMISLGLSNDRDLQVIPYLPERWNSKRVAIDTNKRKSEEEKQDMRDKQEAIQHNITDGLLRYFTKLEDVTEGMDFTGIPFEFDDRLRISISPDCESRCAVLNEINSALKEKHLSR